MGSREVAVKPVTMGLVVLLLNGLVLASVGGRTLASGGERSRVVDEDRFEVRNDVRKLEVEVCPDASKMTLRLQAKLNRGMLTWKLLDPQGRVEAQGEVVPGAARLPQEIGAAMRDRDLPLFMWNTERNT